MSHNVHLTPWPPDSTAYICMLMSTYTICSAPPALAPRAYTLHSMYAGAGGRGVALAHVRVVMSRPKIFWYFGKPIMTYF
jgi:hypothetical protein